MSPNKRETDFFPPTYIEEIATFQTNFNYIGGILLDFFLPRLVLTANLSCENILPERKWGVKIHQYMQFCTSMPSSWLICHVMKGEWQTETLLAYHVHCCQHNCFCLCTSLSALIWDFPFYFFQLLPHTVATRPGEQSWLRHDSSYPPFLSYPWDLWAHESPFASL